MASKPVTPPRLVIIEGKDKGKVIPLKSGTVIIGRSKGDVLVHDPRISRSHVAIHFDDKTGKLSFSDLKSLNGTQINGETLQKGDLNDGDKLQLGNTLFDCQKFSDADQSDLTELNDAPHKKTMRTEKRTSTKEKAKEQEIATAEPEAEEDTFAPSVSHSTNTGASISVSQAQAPEPAQWRSPSARADGPSVSEETTNNSEVSRIRARGAPGLFQRIPKPIRTITLALLLGVGLVMMFGNPSGPDPKQIQTKADEIKKFVAANKFDDAMKEALTLTKLFPENSAVWMILGELYGAQNNMEQSIQAYRNATKFQPPQSLAHARLLKLYLKTGLNDEAMKENDVVEQLLREGGQNKQLFLETAQIYLDHKELKQPPERVFVLAKLLQTSIAPESTVGYKLEAQALFQQNRPGEALTTLQSASKLDPEDEWVIENIAFAKLSMEDVTGATDIVEQWIKLKPNASKGLLVMAYLKYNSKNYLGALPYVQRIVTLASSNPKEPHFAEALSLAGQIYYQQNQTVEAETYLKQSCDMGFARSCQHPLLATKIPASVGNEGAATAPPSSQGQNRTPNSVPPKKR